MIVVDASAMVELLAGGPFANAIDWELRGKEMIAPHLLDVEVANALRRLAATRHIEQDRCREFLTRLAELPVERYGHGALMPRVWELRHNFTPYDACYIALAEQMGAILYTRDRKLSNGHRASVLVFGE